MKQAISEPQKLLLFATGVSALLYLVPMVGIVGLPLLFLNTHLHELCHAVAAIATGGQVNHIEVIGDGSGVTMASGVQFVVSQAGYLGASAVGASMIWLSRKPDGARRVIMGLGIALALELALFLRGNAVGLVTNLVLILALLGYGYRAKGEAAVVVGQFLGIQQCLNALISLRDLFAISAHGGLQTDAGNMEKYYALPAVFWAGFWAIGSLAMMLFALSRAWKAR